MMDWLTDGCLKSSITTDRIYNEVGLPFAPLQILYFEIAAAQIRIKAVSQT